MTAASPDLARRARDIAFKLTAWPSVTGTPDEAAFAGRLAEMLGEMQIGVVCQEPLPNDPLQRSNVFLLKKGSIARTIILAGHFDVVPVDDYGPLKPYAFSPEALLPLLIEKLRRSGENPLALTDLQSGDYLPSRGLLDMKAGLAAGIAALEAYRGEATLLLVATPDEEDRSAGMRAATPVIADIAREHGLNIALVINLDSISDQGDGTLGQSIAFGSIGKLLLTAFVAGKEAHACYPQDGVNAAYLAAELVSEFELAPELAETSGHETAVPPTALHAKDLKSGYNVTTPGQAWVYWNTLQHRRGGAEVLEIAKRLARRAMDRAQKRTNADIAILSYAEIALAPENAECSAISARQELDLPERAKLATHLAWQQSGRAGPAVILGFGSIPYPAVALMNVELERRILAAAQGFPVQSIRYFPGISDMSFIGETSGDLSAVAANTPICGRSFTMPAPQNYPCINIGPWGRDYHHWLERLYAPYAFDVLPRLLLEVIAEVAAD